MFTLPVVDMEDPTASAVISKACKEHGFFYIENHGVSKEMIQHVFDQSKAFFNLETEVKMTLKLDADKPGYSAMGKEVTNKANPYKEETKESFIIRNEAGTSRRGPNQWPSETLVPGWKTTMSGYFKIMQSLAERVTDLLAVSFGVDPAIFQGCHGERLCALRLIHYSSQVSDPEKGVIGVGEHSDFVMLTLLATDDVPGLQVLLNDEWFDIPPRSGAFICNVGDIIQRWTNDHLRSTVHRVVNKMGRERYSIPFFFLPSFDTKVECLPQFCSDDDPAKYPPTTSGEYLIEKLSEVYS